MTITTKNSYKEKSNKVYTSTAPCVVVVDIHCTFINSVKLFADEVQLWSHFTVLYLDLSKDYSLMLQNK
jgi:hypothetical protein